MQYESFITLKNGKVLLMRNGNEADGAAVLDVFNRTHTETDFLLGYPDENRFDAAQEGAFLKARDESPNEIELIAILDGCVVGTAGVSAVGSQDKIRHRAELGIGILREYWGCGVGRALLRACIECAETAGYRQLELEVLSKNERAVALYQSEGFTEFGRNPMGFRTREGEEQALIYMRLELPRH